MELYVWTSGKINQFYVWCKEFAVLCVSCVSISLHICGKVMFETSHIALKVILDVPYQSVLWVREWSISYYSIVLKLCANSIIVQIHAIIQGIDYTEANSMLSLFWLERGPKYGQLY